MDRLINADFLSKVWHQDKYSLSVSASRVSSYQCCILINSSTTDII